MTVKLLTEHHFEFQTLKGDCKARLSLHLSNTTLLVITCDGSILYNLRLMKLKLKGGQEVQLRMSAIC